MRSSGMLAMPCRRRSSTLIGSTLAPPTSIDALGDGAQARDGLEHFAWPLPFDADEPDDLAGAHRQVEIAADVVAAHIDQPQILDVAGDGAAGCVGAVDAQHHFAADHHGGEALLGHVPGLDPADASCPGASR